MQVPRRFPCPVNLISKKRVADARHMDTDLMGPACFQFKFHIGVFCKLFQYPVVGYGVFPIWYIYCHFFPVYGMPSDGAFYCAALLLCNAFYNSNIASGNGMCFDLFCNFDMGIVILQIINVPVVSMSIRWTIPGRITPLMPERLSLQ